MSPQILSNEFNNHKVVAPDMVLMFGPKANTGAVVEPEPPPLGLLLGHLESLLSPDPFNTLVVHPPALVVIEKRRNSPVAVPAVLGGQLDDISSQTFLPAVIRGACRWVERTCPSTLQARLSEI